MNLVLMLGEDYVAHLGSQYESIWWKIMCLYHMTRNIFQKKKKTHKYTETCMKMFTITLYNKEF